MLKKISYLLMVCLMSATVVSCSDDDEPDTGITGDVNDYSALITGLWYCTSQTWVEDGETEQVKYNPSAEYSMRFDENGSGYMKSGSDELFEIMHTATFKWRIRTIDDFLYVHTDVYGGQDYKILYLKGDRLVMQWIDDDFSITCEFVRIK